MRVRDIDVGHRLTEAPTVDVPTFRRVSQIERRVSVEEVYNLVVEGECTFIAGGIVAHSFTNLRVIRGAIYRARFALREKLVPGLQSSKPLTSLS